MNKRLAGRLFLGTVLACCLSSCVSVDEHLGQSYLSTALQYDIYSEEFPLSDIRMDMPDSLSSYSLYRFTFGAIRDEIFGLTTRSAAFTLVPVRDTLDFGKAGTRTFKRFHFTAVTDSVSCADASQANILQNVNVYELSDAIDMTNAYPEIHHLGKRITQGIPLYNGTDSLSFDFSREFGEKYMTMTPAETDSVKHYTKRFPGIYITADAPAGPGGRINMFKLPVNVKEGVIYGSYASLSFSAEYPGKGVRDTSFLFYLGPLSKYDMSGVTSTSVNEYPQIAYNRATHESRNLAGAALDKIYFEGGRGLKPVIKAAPIREELRKRVSLHGNPADIIVSKATLELPFTFPDDYTEIDLYPKILSPTCRVVTDTSVAYAGLSDASASDENQGDINRSLCQYAPDISHHIQELLKLEDEDKISNYDIWFLAMAEEVTSTSEGSSSSSSYSDYLNYLAYNSYYSNMMYGGYGGYGGYGYGGYGYGGYGYGDSYYNNYYNLMMLSALYGSSGSSSEETQTMMDYHRYYRAILNGPASSSRVPTIKVVYAVPKE